MTISNNSINIAPQISEPSELLTDIAKQSEELTEDLLKMTVEQNVSQNSLEHMANYIDTYA